MSQFGGFNENLVLSCEGTILEDNVPVKTLSSFTLDYNVLLLGGMYNLYILNTN